jgi:hypothetical protein
MSFLSALSDREKRVMGLAFFVVLAFASDRFVFQPLQEQGDLMESEIRAKQATVLNYETMLTRQDVINAQWKQLARFIPPQSNPVSKDESDFQTLILLHANQNRVGLDKISPMPQEKGDTHAEYIFEVQIRAGMNDFLKFLYALENAYKSDPSPGFVYVRECEMKPSEDDPNQLKITLTLSKLVSVS